MITVRELQKQVILFNKREAFEEVISEDLLDEAKRGNNEAHVSYSLVETPFNGVEEALDFLSGRGFTKVDVEIVELHGNREHKVINISLSWANAF